MGYISKNIAKVTEPKLHSFAQTPNFLQFESFPSEKVKSHYTVEVIAKRYTPINNLTLEIKTSAGKVHTFKGTLIPAEVSSDVFYLSDDPSETAQNLVNALQANSWIRANFETLLPFNWFRGKPVNGSVINLISKGYGRDFNIELKAPITTGGNAYKIDTITPSISQDSIAGEASTVAIETDLYVNPNTFIGSEDEANSIGRLGSKVATLSKTYASGTPVWFDLNAVIRSLVGHKFPAPSGWSDAGTGIMFRAISNLRSFNSFSFYQSNALFAINGTADKNLDPYVYGLGGLQLLTNQPTTPWRSGQKAYVNFIFRDIDFGTDDRKVAKIGVIYRAFDSAGNFLGAEPAHEIDSDKLSFVNTCAVDFDFLLLAKPTTATVRVALTREGIIVSNDQVFEVATDCAENYTQLVFLNSLGGWDSITLVASKKVSEKVSRESYDVTRTPTSGDGVHKGAVITDIDTVVSLEAQGVGKDWEDWARELIRSKYIYTPSGDPVILSDSEVSSDAGVVTLKIKYNG